MGVMRRRLPWSLSLLLQLVLVMAPLSSCAQEQELQQEKQRQYTMLHEWVKKQQAVAGGGCTCGNKDAALLAAEANRVVLQVDPAVDTSTTDASLYVKTTGEAIAKIPDGNTKRYIIKIEPGGPGTVYREKVFLGKSKPFVTLASADPKIPVVIAWNDTAATLGKDGKPLGPEGSSSVTIESDYFIATGIVFRNDAPPPKEKQDPPIGGDIIALSAGNMAPALRVVGSKATFYKCAVEGGQGALYDHKGLHYYKSCTINGTVDFIFGNARSFYEDCNIVSTFGSGLSSLPEAKPPMTLPPPPADGGGGFSFKTCNISGLSFVYLGRVGWPVVYSYTDIQNDFFPLIVDGDKFEFYNTELTPYFHIAFRNYGGVSPSAIQLKYAEAAPFLGTQFVSGDNWILAIPPARGMDD